MDVNINEKFQSRSTSSLEEEGQHEHVPFVKSEAEKRYVRKLNMRFLPLAMLIIFLQFVDKSALSVAAVLGILKDANLSLTDYSWIASFFYLGYFAFQLPNNILLQRLPIGKYLSTLLICWGIVTIATAFGKNFAQLAVLRVLLGICEAGTYPGLILVVNTLYRRSEQSAVVGALYLSNGVAAMIGSASSVGIASMGTQHGIHAWQWGYLIWGIVTVGVGIICMLLLIDGPNSWFLSLTEEEKLIVEERTRDNAVVRKQKVEIKQYWEAIKEPRLWLLMSILVLHNLQNGGLVTYSTVLVSGLGFNSLQSIILQIPSGCLTVFYCTVAVLIHRKTKQNIWTTVLCYTVSSIGCLLLAVLPNTRIKLLGYYLTWAQTGSNVLIIALISTTVTGYSKKIFYNGANMLATTVGNFVGPLMLIERTKPAYAPTMWAFFAANIVNIICMVTIRTILARSNKKREAERSSEPTDVHLNLTDSEDRNYVYKL